MLDFQQKGELTREDLKQVIHKDNVQAIFASLGIEASDAGSLFRLLDVDGSHGIAIDEFVVGCSRLANGGSHVSMECSVTEIKNQMSTSFKHHRKHFAKLLERETQTQAMVKELLEQK
uniref:EF-hand domain-containing protein n=1 Tax=Noctiluca scintillans TaxID=2966 RepID=A0A7S1A7X2_NOCSC|mmetsp:Transcript_34972/g.93317  ORF Transcript_34972/g.93317 Transcript_34972/m.93317 type:complete len:118 (+) Transcript_34972:2-355(+)